MTNADQQADKKRFPRKFIIFFAVLAVCIAAAIYSYKQYTRTHISTDDAFVDGPVHTIATKVGGTVKALFVVDNQRVKKGDLLLEIDPVDYNVRVDEVEASLSAERSKLAEMDAHTAVVKAQWQEMSRQVEAAWINLDVQKKNHLQAEQDIKKARANLKAQEARLRQAEQDNERANRLLDKGAISQEKHENARMNWEVTAAQVQVAQEQLFQAETARDAQASRVKQAEVEIRRVEAAQETQRNVIRQTQIGVLSQSAVTRQREASLQTVKLNFAYTRIYAPTDGYISKRSVEVGNQVQPGQPLMAIVPLDGIWIIANYKETQLEKVKPGQRVRIKVDTYSGKILNGKVDSIMAGTGSAFSVFPPENATGNFVKVVQRVSVKIVLEKDVHLDQVLRVGMSVQPTIIVE